MLHKTNKIDIIYTAVYYDGNALSVLYNLLFSFSLNTFYYVNTILSINFNNENNNSKIFYSLNNFYFYV